MKTLGNKRKSIILILSALLCGPALAAPRTEKTLSARAGKGFVLFLGSGPVFTSSWETTASVTEWIFPEEALQGGSAVNAMTLALKPQTRLGFDFGLAYYFSRTLGLQFRVDIIAKRPISDGSSDFSMTWNWWGFPTTYSLDSPPTWPMTGGLRAHLATLGLVARFPVGSSGLQACLQAGFAYFMARFTAESRFGYAQTWVEGNSQFIDYYSLPISIDETFNGLGFTGGAGFEWLLGSRTAVFVQADCFTSLSKEVGWSIEPGKYYSALFSAPLTIDEAEAEFLRRYIPNFTVETGLLFRLLAGFKILL
jgi:hypothetical protein